MEEIKFERNWCDYLTTCEYIPNTEIGSYECSTCKYNHGLQENGIIPPGKYFTKIDGTCLCSFKKDLFTAYERVRLRGNHNMTTKEALEESGLNIEEYLQVLNNYSDFYNEEISKQLKKELLDELMK